MRTILVAGVVSSALLLAGNAQAGDPNPEVAKAIQAIAARRLEKTEASAKHLAAAARGEARQRGWVSAAGGGAFTINLGEGGGVIGAPGQVQVILNEDGD